MEQRTIRRPSRKRLLPDDKIFIPKGDYRLSGSLRLGPKTHLFGLSRSFCTIGGTDSGRGRGVDGRSFSLITADDASAAPGLTFLSIRGARPVEIRPRDVYAQFRIACPLRAGRGPILRCDGDGPAVCSGWNHRTDVVLRASMSNGS